MDRKTKLELRASEIRTELAKLADKETLEDADNERITELRAEYATVETQIQAATVAGDEPTRTPAGDPSDDGEAKELHELRARVGFGDYAVAALERRAVGGAAAEYNQALNIGAQKFPLEILAPDPVEERATTDTDTVVRPRRWLDRVFAPAAAMALGVTFESADPGTETFPVTTAGATAAQRGRTEAAADAAWTIGSVEIKPTRNAVRAVFSQEDALRNPGLQDGLNRDLRMALLDGIDKAVFVGDAGANEDPADITGFQTLAGIGESTLTQANKVKWPETVAVFAGMLDGKYAAMPGDLNIVASVGANQLWMSTQANANRNESLAQVMRGNGLSWTSREGIDADTANGDFGAFIGLGRGIEGAACAVVWADGMLVVDPYSKAATGEIALTLNYMWGFKVVRTANFKRLKFVT